MSEVIQVILMVIGGATVAWLAGGCIADMLKNVPDHLPPPRDDSRDTRRQWDRIQGK